MARCVATLSAPTLVPDISAASLSDSSLSFRSSIASPLTIRQRTYCLTDSGRVAEFADIIIRFGSEKGYVFLVHANLAPRDSRVAPCTVDEPIAHDCEQPRYERPRRIVGGTHRVHRQQHVLHEILDLGDSDEATLPPDDLTNTRRDRTQ